MWWLIFCIKLDNFMYPLDCQLDSMPRYLVECCFLVYVRVFLAHNFYFFIYWRHWVFIAAHGLSLVAASGVYSSLQCRDFSLWWLLLLRSTGSVVVGNRLSCTMACGTFPDQVSNLCFLHWQADPYHWRTREVLGYILRKKVVYLWGPLKIMCWLHSPFQNTCDCSFGEILRCK